MATLSIQEEDVCSVCLVQFSKYTCPKCNIRYCSLPCYKNEKHAQCSESFYRASFLAELQHQRASGADRDKMADILKKLDESDALRDQDEEGPTLEERLSGLDIDEEAEQVWDVLTPQERREFHCMARSGALSTHLGSTPPWWEVADRLVVSVEEDIPTTPIPPVPSKLPSLEELMKGKPMSPLLCYHLLNILYGYSYSVRLHGGDHHKMPVMAAQTVLDVSSCLSHNSSFQNVAEALHAAMATVNQNKELFNSRSYSAAILADVRCILYSPNSRDCQVTRALADLHRLLGSALTELKDKSGTQRKKVWLSRKKVYFFLVWSHCHDCTNRCAALAVAVNREYEKEIMAISSAADSEREMRKSLEVGTMDSELSGKSLHGNISTDIMSRKLIEEL